MFGDPRLPERFWSKVSQHPETGCWEWTAAKAGGGYGYIKVGGKLFRSHRLAYMTLVGPIPSHLEIDHLCRNRACCNPEHLEAVTTQVNQLRGESVSAHNAMRTHCPQRHPYDMQNTDVRRTRKRGWARFCKQCNRDRANAYYAANRERVLTVAREKYAAKVAS